MAKPSTPQSSPEWLYIFFWMVMGYSMILFNKAILSLWDFGYPLFLTAWHCLFTCITTQILYRTTNLLPGVSQGRISYETYLTRFVPMAICFALELMLGNMSYRYLSVAFIQMLKSVVPIQTLIASYAVGKEKPSTIQITLLLIITSGVAMTTVGEVQFSMFGFLCQLTALTCSVFRITVLDKFLSDHKLDSLSVLYYMAPISFVFITMAFAIFEAKEFPVYGISIEFCAVLFLNACCAFTLNIAVILVIGKTSALTISLAGLLKDAVLVLSSVVIFHSPLTYLQIGGYAVSAMAMTVYKDYKSENKSIISFIKRLFSYNYYNYYFNNNKQKQQAVQGNGDSGEMENNNNNNVNISMTPLLHEENEDSV